MNKLELIEMINRLDDDICVTIEMQEPAESRTTVDIRTGVISPLQPFMPMTYIDRQKFCFEVRGYLNHNFKYKIKRM